MLALLPPSPAASPACAPKVREAEMAQANATKHHQGEHNRLREKTEGWKNEDELSDLPPSQPLLDSVLNAEQVQTSN